MPRRAEYSRFHETIAKWSGNRFIMQSVERIDSLRRLAEYGLVKHRPSRREHALEHLQLLELIAAGDLLKAASTMREHLEEARRGKIREVSFPDEPS